MKKQDQKALAARFDGERISENAAPLSEEAQAVLREMGLLREGVAAIKREEVIADEQFPTFMRGIREELEAPVHQHHRGLWAAASLVAAAMLTTISLLYIFAGGPDEVKANEVEYVNTDLEGAEIQQYDGEDGTTTLWIRVSNDEML